MSNALIPVKKDLVSVITVCYNAVDIIERTMISVMEQDMPVEYIIVDGGSQDGTLNIVKRYERDNSQWLSEPDKGIYDAMNKGVKLAHGEWIVFMNAGDTFAHDKVLSEVFKNKVYENIDVIYGERISHYSHADYLQKPTSLDQLEKRFNLFHQSTIIRTQVMKDLLYDDSFKICGDYDFFLRLYRQHGKFQYVDMPLSICDCSSGISNNLKYTRCRIVEDCLAKYGRVRSKDVVWLLYMQMASIVKRCWRNISPSTYESWRIKTYDKNPQMKRLTV